MALYLGFDSSTQSLTATVIEIDGARRSIVFEHVLVFDEAFPHFGTTHGVVRSEDGATVTAPPAMWAAALDRMMAILQRHVDVAAIRAISGSAQQHGTVYLKLGAGTTLGSFARDDPFETQVASLLSRDTSPVWLDSSTSAECAHMTSAVGGAEEMARLTGSRAYERFSGAQIRKFARHEPAAYAHTERIHLVSSFMASLLAGHHAPLDPGDASGMNLMDITSKTWAPQALEATAPGLEPKLPPVRGPWTVVGEIAGYWREKYGFGPARIITWSGDNPSSLVGLGLIEPGDLAISLGTSDTVFGPMTHPAHDPAHAGHVFGSPAGGYMALTCFANGSLARERVRDAYGLEWSGFSARLGETEAGNGGAMMLPWFVAEITPPVFQPGVRRRGLDAADAARNVRAIVEAQAMAMRLHSRWIAPDVKTLRATGGAAANREILQIFANVFDADVVRITPRNSASLGAAIRAYHADRTASHDAVNWTDAVAGFTDPDAGSRVRPDPASVAVYAALLPQYDAFESAALHAQVSG
jgi:xylulokinase